jgi:hypothetical protein
MTVTTTTLTASFTGDGTTVTFPFNFYLQETSDLQVSVSEIIQSVGSYTVSINSGNVGGSVVFNTAPANLAPVFLQRVVPITQVTNFSNESGFPALTIINMFDKLTTIDQQVSFTLGLALQLPAAAAAAGVSLVLPAPISSTFLQWDPTATFLQNVTLSPTSTLGPGTTTVNATAIWNSSNGSLLGQVTPGTAGQVYTSNGPSSPPTFQNATTGAVFSPGMIMPFYVTHGVTIPSGWVVCDGTNNTPNLIGVILIGAQNTGGSQTPPSISYGNIARDTALGSANHTHTVSVNGSGTAFTGLPSGTTPGGSAGTNYASLSHGHYVTVAVSSSGTTAAQNVQAPAGFGIVYIMKQ